MQTDSDDMKSCIRYSESECDIVLHSTLYHAYMGGIAGYISIGEIHDCYFKGIISASDDAYAGGIAGRLNGVVRNCYSVGSITGIDRYDEFATEENGYNYPSWFKLVSGLIGRREYSFADDQRVENCFTLAGLYSELIGEDEWNTDSGAIRELSDDEMKRAASYENWDFSSVWTLDSATNYEYPALRKPEVKQIVVKASLDVKTLLFIALIAVGSAGCALLVIVCFRNRKKHEKRKKPETEQTPSFCPYCGQRIADGSRFCGNCGNKI